MTTEKAYQRFCTCASPRVIVREQFVEAYQSVCDSELRQYGCMMNMTLKGIHESNASFRLCEAYRDAETKFSLDVVSWDTLVDFVSSTNSGIAWAVLLRKKHNAEE